MINWLDAQIGINKALFDVLPEFPISAWAIANEMKDTIDRECHMMHRNVYDERECAGYWLLMAWGDLLITDYDRSGQEE